MYRQLLRPVSAMVLALAAGGPALVAASPIAAAKAVDPARVNQAQNHLSALQAGLGLTGHPGFLVRHALVNEQGRTIIHFQQTHQGVPVWNGAAIVHVDASGQVSKVVNGLLPGIQLTGAPALSAAQASARALRDLAPKGAMPQAPEVRAVVFPSSRTGGFATKLDPVTHKVTLDKEYSVWAKAPAAPYVWAYEVKTSLRNAQDGMKQVTYIIDGNTGAILKKWNDLRSDTAAQGTGASLYNGTVNLGMTQSTDGTYALVDPTRGGLSSPNWLTGTSGLSVAYDWITYYPWGNYDTPMTYTGNPTSAWGDGTLFTDASVSYDPAGDYGWTGILDPSGQTNAVDAMFGMATAWDMFGNVFGLNGMDNQGSSLVAEVHPFAPTFGPDLLPYGGHQCFPPILVFGDGASGTGPQTELDIVGHEMVHAFAQAVPNFYYQGESGALEEATSDILGKMVQAYAQPGGGGATIPDFTITAPSTLQSIWSFGYNADRGTPERYYYKPSLDGTSPDGWYDGISLIWPWYSNGPLNRMFFFLVNGTSAVPTDANFSSFLPVATAGIGNDAAARIWMTAVTGFLTPTSGLFDAQVASVAAATQLFGADSAQVTAVQNAFAAVNIGDAPGQPKRVKVTFPVMNAADTVIGQGGTVYYPAGSDAQYQFFPPHTRVKVKINVENATNPAVTWSYGTAMEGLTGGTLNADGTWTTPFSGSPNPSEPYVLVATSLEAPNQYAVGSIFVINVDADSDTVTDAMDLGQVAACWGLNYQQNPYPTTQLFDGTGTGDWDIAMFDQVLTNAWPVN